MEGRHVLSGFSDNPFMIGYDNRIFQGDEDLGFRFPEGNLVGSDCFVSLDSVINDVKWKTGYPVILNIGDSSTAGWNGNKVFKGNGNPHAVFFTYKTYSDILREHPVYQNTINAGVPGYTSLQGRKYLEKLLKRLSLEGIHVDYVTLYFGNNDGTYNRLEDKVRLEGKKASQHANGERITVQDYAKNILTMIDTVQEYGAKPITIIPPIHYDWEPGIRSDVYREESLEVLEEIEGTELAEEINLAREAFRKGDYQRACERDRLLPRLKLVYRKTLKKISKERGIPLIDIQRLIPFTNNGEYFIDYCHPLEKANVAISRDIVLIVNKDIFYKSISQRMRRCIEKLRKDKRRNSNTKPLDIYSLY